MTTNQPPLETLRAMVATNDPNERVRIWRAANPSTNPPGAQYDFLAGFRKMMGGKE